MKCPECGGEIGIDKDIEPFETIDSVGVRVQMTAQCLNCEWSGVVADEIEFKINEFELPWKR